VQEERTLQTELPGYEEHTAQVRNRFSPQLQTPGIHDVLSPI